MDNDSALSGLIARARHATLVAVCMSVTDAAAGQQQQVMEYNNPTRTEQCVEVTDAYWREIQALSREWQKCESYYFLNPGGGGHVQFSCGDYHNSSYKVCMPVEQQRCPLDLRRKEYQQWCQQQVRAAKEQGQREEQQRARAESKQRQQTESMQRQQAATAQYNDVMRAQQQAAETKRRADDDSRRQKDELIAQGVHGLVELFFGDNKAKSDESSSKSEKDYSKYHDNTKKAKDEYDKRVGTDSVVKKIQDKSLELLKQKNLETVRRMDEITASVNQITNPFDSPASSSPEWKSTTPLPIAALNLPSENPWGAGNKNDRTSAAEASDSAQQLNSRQATDNISEENPWASGLNAPRAGGVRGAGDEIVSDPLVSRDNPSADSSAPTKQPSTSRPLANAAMSTGNSSRYVDPKSGTEYVVPEGYVLYRDPSTKQIRVVSRADLPANTGGDDTVKGKCSANGLLVITPKCEKARKRGS